MSEPSKVKQHTHDQAIIVELEGDADLVIVQEFRTVMREHIKSDTKSLIVDFSKVNFVSTPTWAVIVEYFKHTQKSGGGIALAGLQGRAEASFNIVRLGEFILHRPTIAEAIAALDA